MTDASLSPAFEKALPKIVTQIAEDLGQLLSVPVTIDGDSSKLVPMESIFPSDGTSGAVCCRAVFARTVNGVGGVLLSESLANRLSYAAMMLPAPAADAPLDWDGLVHDAIDEIFNIVVGSWNNACPTDLRLGSAAEERSVELYPAGVEFPTAAGVVPFGVVSTLTLEEFSDRITIFVPVTAIHGRAVGSFQFPGEFVKNVLGPEPERGETGSEPVAPTYQGPVRPVVFVDYTGSVVAWIRQQAALAKVRAFRSTGPSSELRAGDNPPATVLVGVDPSQLEELTELPFVEIRPQ